MRLPSAVLGPVLLSAFRRFACNCRHDVMSVQVPWTARDLPLAPSVDRAGDRCAPEWVLARSRTCSRRQTAGIFRTNGACVVTSTACRPLSRTGDGVGLRRGHDEIRYGK